MHNVSEHFICIPLRFPCRPWLRRKPSQWLINCLGRSMRGARSQGQSGYSQCLHKDGEHFQSRKTAMVQNNTLIHATWQRSACNQTAVMISAISRKWCKCVTHINWNRRHSLSTPCLCFLSPPRMALIRGVRPHFWMCLSLSPANCCVDMTS